MKKDTMRDKIGKAWQKRADRAEKRLDEVKPYRSAFYHRYFEGWSEREEEDPLTGKKKTRREYTGKYFIHPAGEKGFLIRKILYPVLVCLSLAFFGIGMSRHVTSNYSRYATFPGALAMIGYLFLVVGVVRYATRPYKMKHWDYRCGPENLRTAAMITAILVGLNCLVSLVLAIATGTEDFVQELQAFLLKLTSMISVGILWLSERRTQYKELSDSYEDRHGWIKITDT
ncbi:MAG: hypothetical protein LUH07_13845 [Lachnospiraceae bacterium]|nr:hypothetical protein [Lachnospiraceae bacterium]